MATYALASGRHVPEPVTQALASGALGATFEETKGPEGYGHDSRARMTHVRRIRPGRTGWNSAPEAAGERAIQSRLRHNPEKHQCLKLRDLHHNER
jgi:hypothetical protein